LEASDSNYISDKYWMHKLCFLFHGMLNFYNWKIFREHPKQEICHRVRLDNPLPTYFLVAQKKRRKQKRIRKNKMKRQNLLTLVNFVYKDTQQIIHFCHSCQAIRYCCVYLILRWEELWKSFECVLPSSILFIASWNEIIMFVIMITKKKIFI
jgi:hypothetical protein